LTFNPFCASSRAAQAPPKPDPITITSTAIA
jgi:hypothetical protein